MAKYFEVEVFYAHKQDARGQAEAGFGVEFEWDISLLDGYRYRFLRNVARQPGLGRFNGCNTPEIYEIVHKGRFDAFLVFGWNRRSSLQTINACWKENVPVLMRGDSQLETRRSRVKTIAKFLPYRWFLPRLSGHLYVGQRNKEYLMHYGVREERLFFSPHFVDNNFFSNHADIAFASGKHTAIRRELGIPQDAFVILFVGKFIPKKRPMDFIRACLQVLRLPEGDNVHAILVGDGPLARGLRLLARPRTSRIHFVGFRNQSEIPSYYKAADVLVLPSNGNETWGLVVNEAMACGIPVIVSDTAGCAPDLIGEDRTGYTYPEGDIDSLSGRILDMKRICIHEQEYIKKAVETKINNYSIDMATEGLMTALNTIVR